MWANGFCAERGLGADELEWLVRADGDGLVPREELFRLVRARWGLPESVEELLGQYRRPPPVLRSVLGLWRVLARCGVRGG